jgi:hypothetical protein
MALWDVATSFNNGQIVACGGGGFSSNSKLCWRYLIESNSWIPFQAMQFTHNRMPGKKILWIAVLEIGFTNSTN